MESLVNKDNFAQENQKNSVNLENVDVNTLGVNANATSPNNHVSEQKQQQNQPQKTKRKHRRGKPKPKNANKPYKNWKFQVPRPNFNGCGGGMNNRNGARPKILRSRSLVPYNTNKFLMEEHLAEVPSSLLTPSGRTRDSSFSVDSEDNYFFSLPEDEEEFLTKEFANVYEKARVERLENLTKQQLIEECLQIEDRYSSDQGRQQQLNAQRISSEFMSKIRILEEKVRELSRENYNLRCQLMRSAAMAVAASPPSAAPPTGAACQPTPMDSSSVDSESDSSSSSSSSSSSNRSAGLQRNNNIRQRRVRRSCSSHSSLSDYRASNENDQMESDEGDNIVNGANVIDANAENKSQRALINFNCEGPQSNANDRSIVVDAEMEDDFPSFSPILDSVESAQSLENAAAALEVSQYNKNVEATESGEQN
uniref:Protein HEXIM1 n=1 Tax=Bactrocera dorsalis TaxID=27457 RepID=A0A034V7Z0_BACDO